MKGPTEEQIPVFYFLFFLKNKVSLHITVLTCFLTFFFFLSLMNLNVVCCLSYMRGNSRTANYTIYYQLKLYLSFSSSLGNIHSSKMVCCVKCEMSWLWCYRDKYLCEAAVRYRVSDVVTQVSNWNHNQI